MPDDLDFGSCLHDPVTRPSHYISPKYELLDVIEDFGLSDRIVIDRYAPYIEHFKVEREAAR